MIAEIKSRLKTLDTSNKELRKFGLLLSIVLCIVAGVMLIKNNTHWRILAGIAGVLLLFGLLTPPSIKWFYKLWMTFGLSIGWIMTRVILTLTFYLFITPMGLFLKIILRKDLLDEKIEKKKETHWKIYKPVTDKSRYLKRY